MRLFFSFWLVSITVFSQNNEEVFQTIKTQFDTITNLKEEGLLQEKTNSYSCPDQSLQGILSYFYQSSKLQLITHTLDQGHHSVTYHYYINNDLLFFCFIEEGFDNDQSIYDSTNQNLIATNENWNVIQKRIYFFKETPIKCLLKEYGSKDITEQMQSYDLPIANYFKNKQVDCAEEEIQKIKQTYLELTNPIKNLCLLEY